MVNFILIIIIAITGNGSFDKKTRDAVSAIQFVESTNNHLAIGDTHLKNFSVGLGQIRLNTGAWIINRLTPEGMIKRMLQAEIKRIGIKAMLLNPTVNTYLSRTYVKWLKRYHGGKIKEAIISYNTGQGAKEKIRNTLGLIYYRKVIKVL